jgi:hypothetical protein
MISVKVGGYNTGGYGELRESPTYYTLAAAPGFLTVTDASFQTVKLEWNPMLNSSQTPYEVSMSEDPDFLLNSIPVPFNNSHTSTAAAIMVEPARTYYFRVRAMNHEGITTAYSSTVSTITVSNVNNLTGNPVTMSSIRWDWDPASGNPGYDVYDITGDTANPVYIGSSGVNSFTQVNLSTNTRHRVTVNARAGTNVGPAASSGYFYSLAVQPTALPTDSVSTGTLALHWITNGNPEYTRYKVNLSTDG